LRPLRRWLVMLAAILLTFGIAHVQRASADPVPFATITGAVSPGENGYQEFPGPVITAPHDAVIYQVTQTGDAGIFLVDPGGLGLDYAAGSISGDPVWQGGNYDGSGLGYAPGDVPEIEVSPGDEPSSFTVEFFDEPTAPVSFSGGSSTADYDNDWGEGHSLGYSTLSFGVAHTAPFQATIALSGGAINVAGHTIASPGTLALGTLTPGSESINVLPVDGPDARWTISIAPLPITLYSTHFSTTLAAPGTVERLLYSVDGQTSMTITVANASGQVVRTLASGFSVGPGGQQIVWDGRTAAGKNVPDGVYTATATSTDPQGNVSTQTATIVIQRPVAPLLRTLVKTWLINLLVGSPQTACKQLTPSAQANLKRHTHKQTCGAAMLKVRAINRAKTPQLKERGFAVRAVNEIAEHLRVHQTGTFTATGTYQSRTEFKAVEIDNRWLITG
jgi:hypothetical protein